MRGHRVIWAMWCPLNGLSYGVPASAPDWYREVAFSSVTDCKAPLRCLRGQVTTAAFVGTDQVRMRYDSLFSTAAVLSWRMLTPNSKVILILLAWLLQLPISVAQSSCVRPELVSDSKFAPGQVWSYKTRPGEEGSTITILRIEETPKLGTIVHVRIDGIHFSNCTGGPSPSLIQHAPISRAALEASVIAKLTSVPRVPDYAAGYQDWLVHCGGVYTIPVDRVIAADDVTFNAGLGCR